MTSWVHDWVTAFGYVSLVIYVGAALYFTVGKAIAVAAGERRVRQQQVDQAVKANGVTILTRRSEAVIQEESGKILVVLKLVVEKLDALTQAMAQSQAQSHAQSAEPEIVAKRHTEILMRLDAMVDAQEASTKALKKSMEMVFGGPGYSAVDDEQASLRERAEKLQKRYRLTYEEAMQQAKASQVYESNDPNGMRDRV